MYALNLKGLKVQIKLQPSTKARYAPRAYSRAAKHCSTLPYMYIPADRRSG